MRKLCIMALAVLGPGLAIAEEPVKKPDQKSGNCFYTVGTQEIQIPIGGRVCRRQPAPFNDKYSLLLCNPPLNEIDSDIKRGDARCDRYEEKE